MNSKPKNIQNLTPEADQDTKLQREPSVEPPPSHTEIARRAHEIYEERGRDHGHDLDDWLQSEHELHREAAVNKKEDISASFVIAAASAEIPLKWDVFVTKRQGLTRDLPPGKEQWMWVPTSATLIYGKRDAVLVDAMLTIEQASALVEWVAASGKNLTTIYVTHGHGDHFFGTGALLDRFPNAKAVATPDTVKVMRQQASPESIASFWNARYPGQIPERLVIAEELKGNVIELEGRDLVVVEVGHTDTDHTTCLHVPSVSLVVAGDAAYNDVHLYLAESNAQTRREWISALDTIEALKPHAVIAGHKKPEKDDSPGIIEETRQYIRDFDRVARTSTTARELYNKMLELYPDRANPGSLWGSARAAMEPK
jgi:glyoxylase-like metal-dependent hydrolase (beta-lactamase superfamily II)